jgi:predicted DNA-binding transcriptional regulator AlpA
VQRSAHLKKLTARFTFFVSHNLPQKTLDNVAANSDTELRMIRSSTREAAKKLGISYETLAHYIAVGKVAAPEIAKVGKRVIHMWTDAEIEHVRQLLPKIANGRKTRYQKLRAKQKGGTQARPARRPKKKKS